MYSYLLPPLVVFHFRNYSFYQLVCPNEYTDWCLELNSLINDSVVQGILQYRRPFESPALSGLVPNLGEST